MSTPVNESEASYRAARDGAALIDRSDHAGLVLTGADALDLLHRTTTADLSRLAPGQFATTLIQTETGRILDRLLLWRRTNDLLIVTGPGRGPADLEWVDRMVIMDDVTVRSLEPTNVLFELSGPEAPAILGRLGLEFPGLGGAAEPWCLETMIDNVPITLATARLKNDPECWLIVSSTDAPTVVTRLTQASATPVGHDVSETIRLLRGQPEVGRELTAEANPLEARLNHSIGFQKGCYPGQEVIARLITYKSVKRILSLLRLERMVASPPAGTSYPLTEGTAAGRITSTAWSFEHGAPLAMGYLRNDLATTGTRVEISTVDGPVSGQVLDFPTAGTEWN